MYMYVDAMYILVVYDKVERYIYIDTVYIRK